MTDLRTAAQQALEALEWCEPAGTVGAGGIATRKAAITNLRAALEQPEQQHPVTWHGLAPDETMRLMNKTAGQHWADEGM